MSRLAGRAGEGISTNILVSRLTTLEREGIIEKHPDPEHGARYVYFLTDKGIGLLPAMLEIIDWAETWDYQTEVPPESATELRMDRSALATKIARNLKASRTLAKQAIRVPTPQKENPG